MPLSWGAIGLKVLPYGLALLAILGAVLYIDHRGYKRAEDQNALEKAIADKNRAELKNYIDGETNKLSTRLNDTVVTINQNLAEVTGKLKIEKTTIVQPTIEREISNDKRYIDPTFINSVVLDSLNKARSASSSTCLTTADGRFSCTLPPSDNTP